MNLKVHLFLVFVLFFSVPHANSESRQIKKKQLNKTRDLASFVMDGVGATPKSHQEDRVTQKRRRDSKAPFRARNIEVEGKKANVNKTMSPAEFDLSSEEPRRPNSCSIKREFGLFDEKSPDGVSVSVRADLLLINTGLRARSDIQKRPFHIYKPKPGRHHKFDEFIETAFFRLPKELKTGPIGEQSRFDRGSSVSFYTMTYSTEEQKFVSVDQYIRKSDNQKVCRIIEVTTNPDMTNIQGFKVKITVPHPENTPARPSEESCKNAAPLMTFDCLPEMIGSR